MNHREISLKFLTNTGLIPVKVRPNQKDPFPDWDPMRAEKQDHALTLRLLASDPTLNIGALFTGKYVDIDVDTKNPLIHAALDYFLPATQYVWGRKSKRKGHRVFVLHEDFNRAKWSFLTRYLKGLVEGTVVEDSLSIEVRGGEAKNGMFAVLPGSTHSGEMIEWQEGVDPSMGGAYVEDNLLMRCIRMAVMSAIIASIWQPGQRNDVSLAFAGLLWRIKSATLHVLDIGPDDEVPLDQFVLTMDDAVAMLKCVMKISGDDKEDERSRLLNLQNTWRKLDGDNSARVSGGKILAEIAGDNGPRIVKAAYRLLSDNDAAEQMEKLAEQFVMWYGMGVLIDLDMVTASQSNPWMTYIQAKYSLGGKKVTVGDKRILIVDMMFNTSIIDRVYGLTFDPSCNDLVVNGPKGLMINQWRGFECEPHPQEVKADDVRPFLEYIRDVVSAGRLDAYQWVMAWMADMFQHPADKPGTSLVLVGVQGAGKTFLGEKVLGPMVGDIHYTQINSVDKLTKNFNKSIDNKIFVQCDESIHSYQKDIANRLKSLITDKSIEIEPKGIDSYRKPNHIRLMFTSNMETAALFIDPSPYERRYTVLRVSDERATDIAYWKHMHEWVADNRAKIMRYLMDYEYNRDLITRPIMTEAKSEMQRVGLDPEVAWIINRVQNGFLIGAKAHQNWFDAYNELFMTANEKKRNTLVRTKWPTRVTAQALEDDFRNFVREHGRPVYTGSVLTTLRKVLPPGALSVAGQVTVNVVDQRTGQESKERIRVLSVPDIREILVHLQQTYGPVIEKVSLEDLIELNTPDKQTKDVEEF